MARPVLRPTDSFRVAQSASVAPHLPRRSSKSDDDRRRIAEQVQRRSEYARTFLAAHPPSRTSSRHSSLKQTVKPVDNECKDGAASQAVGSPQSKAIDWDALEEEDTIADLEEYYARNLHTHGVGYSMKERLARTSHHFHHHMRAGQSKLTEQVQGQCSA